jgi:hypothetical protein
MFSWEAGCTFPLGPLMVYEGSAGGVVPPPNNVTPVPFTRRLPVTGPVVMGANVIGKLVDLPAAREMGASVGTENGGSGLAVTKVMVVGDVPEFVTVNVTFSDLLTAMDGKTTPVVPVEIVVPFEV